MELGQQPKLEHGITVNFGVAEQLDGDCGSETSQDVKHIQLPVICEALLGNESPSMTGLVA